MGGPGSADHPHVVGAVCEDRGVGAWSKTGLSYEWFEKIS